MIQLIEALILLSILPTTWFFTGGWNTPSPYQKYTGNAWRMAYIIERERKTPEYRELPWHKQRQVMSHYGYEFDSLSMKQRRAWGQEWERRRNCGCDDCMSGMQTLHLGTYSKTSRRQLKVSQRNIRNAERIARKELDAFGYSPSSQLP